MGGARYPRAPRGFITEETKRRRAPRHFRPLFSTYSLAAVNYTPIRIAGRSCISIISTMGTVHLIFECSKLADIPTI
jgi:hypothetical protein